MPSQFGKVLISIWYFYELMHSNAVCNSTLETTKITGMENFGLVLIRIGPMTSHRMTAIVLHLSGQPAYCLCHKPWTKMELQVTPCMGWHYSDVIMSAKVSQITCVSIICSAICSDADQRKHQRSGSLAFVRGIHQWLVDSPHKGPVSQKVFLPFDDIIM